VKKPMVEQARDDDAGKADEPHLDPFTESLLEYAADAVRTLAASKSRRKRSVTLPTDTSIAAVAAISVDGNGNVAWGPAPNFDVLREIVVGTIDGPTVRVDFKRSRGGKEFGKHRPSRFFMDPNKVAAAIAVSLAEDLRRAPVSEPKMNNKRDLAAEYSVELVNKHYIHLLPRCRKANVETVKELLRQARTNWPSGNEY
jgi:hypothetical protein